MAFTAGSARRIRSRRGVGPCIAAFARVKEVAFGISLAAAMMACGFVPARALSVPAMLQVGAQSLAAASCATRDTLWIHHYAAVLYVAPRAAPVAALEDPGQPKALQVRILNRMFLPREMPRRWRATVESELDAPSIGAVRAAWRSLGAGDRITLAYAPGPGVSLEVNDRLVAAAPGHALVDALLRTWADDEPVRERARRIIGSHPCAR